MSPEQARGRAVDKRADIWAFGCVLYEMITGRQLFDGADLTETMAAVVSRTRPHRLSRASCGGFSRSVWKKTRRAGCATSATRGTCSTMIPSREWIGQEKRVDSRASCHGLSQPRQRSRPSRRLVDSVLATGPSRGCGDFRFMPLQAHDFPPGTPAVSPDGRTFVYRLIDIDGTARIHVRPINHVESRALPGTDGAGHLFWSPDGGALAFTVGGQLRRIDCRGRLARFRGGLGPVARNLGPAGRHPLSR